eukprot:5724245-Pleurochrysis_carterae.AAC.1
MANVGDVHANLEVAVWKQLGVQRVVNVDAAGRVDRADERAAVAQIEPLGDLFLRDLPTLLGQARLHLRREGRRVHLVLVQDGLTLGAAVADVAQRAHVVTRGVPVLRLPKVDRDEQQLVAEVLRLPCGDVDPRDASVQGLREVLLPDGAFGVEHAHVRPPRAPDDADDDAARPAAAAAVAAREPLAVHRLRLAKLSQDNVPARLASLQRAVTTIIIVLIVVVVVGCRGAGAVCTAALPALSTALGGA